MDKKKIFIILGSIILIIVLVLIVFYGFICKGALSISPRTPGSTVLVNNAVYDSFPVNIRLKPGKYQVLVTKDGYLPSKNSYKILAFQTLSIQPELKEFYLVNYFDADNFMAPKVANNDNEIYFYNYGQKVIQKMPIYFTQSEIANSGVETVSIPLSVEGKKDELRIFWSPLASKAAILDKTGVTIYDRLTNQIYRANGIQALTFKGEDEVIYSDVSGIYQSGYNLTGLSKIGGAITGVKTLVVTNDKTLLAIGGKTLIIYDLAKQKNFLELNKKINQIKWADDNWLAFSEPRGGESQLSILNITNGKPHNLGLIKNDRFIWQNNYLVYLTKDGNDTQVAKYDKLSNVKTFLYRPAVEDEMQYILGKDDKLIFSTLNDKPMLIAIKLD